MPHLRPVRIFAGALGKGLPVSDLLVCPQHRILVRSRIAARIFDADEVLVAATQLTAISGIDIAEDEKEVEYFHFLFDQHEIVYAEGAETESLYTGPEALNALSAAAVREIFEIFPELVTLDPKTPSPPARRLIPGKLGRNLAKRHCNNQMPLST